MWIGLVWIKMTPDDTLLAAKGIAQTFDDTRVEQFYDPFQKSGTVIARTLPVNAPIAWDIYLFYKARLRWDDNPPKPTAWMHQMSDTDPESRHLRCSDDLADSLLKEMYILEKSE